MATKLTQAEWFDQIKGMVPTWVFAQENHANALFQAIAKIAETCQTVADAHVTETFISQATGVALNSHGAERRVSRLPGEVDPIYSVRVRNLFNQSNLSSLTSMVNELLLSGTARIQEDFDAIGFLDREYFASRGVLFLSVNDWVNTFSILVDKQLHAPYSFASREHFADREDFIGASESLLAVFQAIQRIVDDNKALGVFYRILENTSGD